MMVLRAEGISRRFYRQVKGSNVFYAVQETSLDLPGHSLTAVVGRSGSGKSTLLNMLSGLLVPTTGRVLLDGVDLYALPDVERSRLRNEKLGVIPQTHTALRSLTVLENVGLPASLYGVPFAQETGIKLLEQVGIAHLKDAYPNELSGGELRRLAVARALSRHPFVLLADEPTSNLDDENARIVLRLLRRCAEEGAAVLLVTHDRDAAESADRLLTMQDGVLSGQ